MRTTAIFPLSLLVLALAGPPAVARAHVAGERTMGVVDSVTSDRIVLKASDGHALTFVVTPQTRFLRLEKPIRAEDVRVGERAVVHARRAGDSMQATRVKLGGNRARR
jgi:hypothetical protein